MIVKELIDYLQTCNPDLDVKVCDWGEHYRSHKLLTVEDIYQYADMVLLADKDW